MSRVLGMMMVAMTTAAPLTFTHLGSTWTLEVEGDELHVKADCPETAWCGFGFNEDLPVMNGADVFTFGFHNGVDLSDCPTAGGCGCGGGCNVSGCGCGCGCGTTTKAACGCGRRLEEEEQNPYVPRVRELKVHLPPVVKLPGKAQTLEKVGGVVGIAMNSVLMVHEHPEEGMTWLFDDCGGHGDTYGHYHYHAPPLCLMKSLGLPVPTVSSWWKTIGHTAWPLTGPEVQIGWALDGAPIMGPFKDGIRTHKKMLDECHGAMDATSGEYRYYLVPEAPYMPPCLRGANLGNVTSFRTSKEGKRCEKSDAQTVEVTIVNGGKVLTGHGCPEHEMFKSVVTGKPFGMSKSQKSYASSFVRRLHNHGKSKMYGTCPTSAACGCGCGSGCGCGTTKAACGCGCGCGTTKAACGCGCGCGTTTKAACGCGCGTTTAACGCGCGTTTAACGCGCGTTTAACGCGCGATYDCPGQMFCAMGLTKKTSGGTPVSLSQCNLLGHSITIDAKQDLTKYSLTFANGRMMADAHRKLNTDDSTDLVLTTDKSYYVLLTVGVAQGSNSALQVGYHGASATQTLVCETTLLMKGECKPPASWDSVRPGIVSSSAQLTLGLFSMGLALAIL